MRLLSTTSFLSPLKTFGDAYQLVVFENKENGLFEDASGAVQLLGEKGDVKLTVAPLLP